MKIAGPTLRRWVLVGALFAATVTAAPQPAVAVGQSVTAAQTAELVAAGLLRPGESWACEGDGSSSVSSCLGRFGYALGQNVSWGGGTFLPYNGNCTHYAAWRAKSAGAPSFFDTKSSDGVSTYDAANWDNAAQAGARRAAVDKNPQRGDVVQWDGVGYLNHVGYVEYVGRASDGSVSWFATSEAKYDSGKGGARRAVYVRGTNGFAGADFIHVGGAPTVATPPAAPIPPAAPVISDGDFVRTPDTAVYVIAGGAKYHVSADEYAALGRPAFRDVPAGALDAYGTMPADNTFLRTPADGAIFQIVGGAAYWLDADEYAQLGRPRAINVPGGFVDRASSTAPEGVRYVRDLTTGAVYQVLGGVKTHLTPQDYVGLGSPRYVDIPAKFAARISDAAPSGSWFLRDRATMAVYEVVGGAKVYLSADEYAALGRPAFQDVPSALVARLSDGAPAGQWVLRDRQSTAVFLLVGGAKYHLSPEEYAALGRPAFLDVPSELVARASAEHPAGRWILRDVSTTAVYEVIDGVKRHLSPEEYAAMSRPAWWNVPSAWLASFPEAGTGL